MHCSAMDRIESERTMAAMRKDANCGQNIAD